MDDNRLARLETRVDEIKDDLAEVKADQKASNIFMQEFKAEFKEHKEIVKEHVMGDNKVINQIMPLLSDMSELIYEHKFAKEAKKRKITMLKDWSLKIGLISAIVATIYQIGVLFFSN